MKIFLEKIIAITLVFVMVFNFGSVTLAASLNLIENTDSNDATVPGQNIQQEELEIVGEDETKRTLTEKHFILNNGTTLVAKYAENVHYEKDGKMEDVDNSLEEKQVGNKTVYKNKSNSYKANFAKTTDEDGNLVSMESDGYEINWFMQSAKKESMGLQLEEITEIKENNEELLTTESIEKELLDKTKETTNELEVRKPTKVEEKIKTVDAKVIEKEKRLLNSNSENEKIEEKTNLEKVTSSIKYENILNEIDLQYDVKAERIKESIIINSKEGLQEEFIFKFNTGELKAELLDNKEIVIYKEDKEEYIFKIEAPYMFDSNEEYSSDIEVKLEQDEDTNEYILTLIPSKEWLEDKERVYPITIDPTISTSRDYQDIQDTYIYEGDAGNYTKNTAHILRVGNRNRAWPRYSPTRTLIKFTLPELSAGDQVIYAALSLCSYPDTDEWAPPTRIMQMNLHKMTTDWVADTAFWADLNTAYNGIVEDFQMYQFDVNEQFKFYDFNITGMVKEWYTTGNNYGLMLKEHYETDGYESDAYFLSADTYKETFYYARPVVTIVYRNQTGIEDYLSYHTQSIGRAGTIYTNDYNGNLVLTHYDAGTPGGRLPVSINHVFNTNDKDKNIGYGKGYRLNLSQTIEFQTINDVVYGKYVDEDGTAHYFKQEGSLYKDEDGLGLTLYKEDNICRLEDKSGNRSHFTKVVPGKEIWHLTKITDTEGNSIDITVDQNGAITKVTDGANQVITITYAGENVEKITDSSGKVTTYGYSNSNLTQIKYSDNKYSYYTYDSQNKLTSAKNIDGMKIGYEYYTEKTSRVKKIQEYSSNNEIGNSLQISYGDNSTIFTDEDGYSNTIVFNNYGNAISIADFGKENNVDGAYGKMYSYGVSGGSKNKLTLESKMISVKEMPNNLVKNPYFDNGLNDWTTNELESWDIVENIGNNNVFRVFGTCNRYKYIRQNVNVSGSKGDIFNISSWIKTQGVPNEDGKSTRISLNIIGNDNSSQWVDVWANVDSSSWQFLSQQFTTNYDYSRIDIYLIYYLNANMTYFDNIGLFKEDFGQSYTYDSEGNLVSTQDEAKQNSEFSYNGVGSLLNSINPKGGSYVYEYDFNNKNKLLEAINSTGIEYTFDYDDNGNTTAAKVTSYKESDAPENGQEYYIKVASSDRYFTVAGTDIGNGAKIVQWENVGKQHQKYVLEDAGEGYFKIHPSHDTNMTLEVNTNDNTVQQWASNSNTNQLWKFIENSDGTYRVISKYKGEEYCLALKDDSKYDGGEIVVEKWEGKQNQKIMIFKTNSDYNPIDDDKVESNDVYHIRVKSSNLYLEQQSTEVGSRIVQNTYKPNDKNQLWRIVRLDNGRYKLVNLGSLNGNVIDVYQANNSNENALQMYTNTTSNKAQEWYVRKDSKGLYEIGTALDGVERRITVYWDLKDPGTHMALYEPNGCDNQKFYLEKANLLDIESGATYKIKGKQSGLYVGVNSSNNMLQIQNEASANQEWIIENLNNGYYKFKLKGNENQVIDVYNAGTANGTKIGIHSDTNNDAQKFEIVAETDGTYYIKHKLTLGTTSLNVAGSVTNAGAQIEHWSSGGWDSQKFELIKTESNNDRKYIETSAEYTEDGRYQTKVIDTSGNEVEYEYNQTTGTTSKVTDAKGNETNYEYDSLDRVTKVSKVANGQTYQNEYTYENDRIKSILHNGTTYYFEYDTFGNTKQTKVGSQVLGTNNYEEGNGLLSSFVYGNGQEIDYTYDRFERIIKEEGTNGSIEYTYDAKGNLKTVKDNVNNVTQTYTYDLADRLVRVEDTNGYKVEYEYDANSNISKTKYTLAGEEKATRYNYDRDNRINSIVTANDITVTNYDTLSRVLNTQIKRNGNTYTTEYTYVDTDTENKTTEKVKSIKNGNNEEISYTYDANGNIETITEGEEQKQRHYYDGLNQLIREDNKDLNKTIAYTYDLGGNILTKKEYVYTQEMLTNKTPINTITYTYGNTNWKDQLTSYDGKEITYDAIGNPLTYDGNTYTWQNGRELASITNSSKTIQYKYNDSGIRVSKTVNGVETKYYLEGSNIIYETKGTQTIYYTYNQSGDIIGLNYGGNDYYYVKNIQGDIIGILNSNLQQIARYEYDSWGNITKITDNNGNNITDETNIALINPFRYRSYYYDTETNLYYLNSRYYNPQWGRFINADSVIAGIGGSIQGYNMFEYCFNNPVNMLDSSGYWLQSIKDAANWINNNIIKPIVNFFSPSTNTISGQFNEGIFRGSGSLSGGYSEGNGRLQVNSKDNNNNGMLGGFGKASVGNASGKVGIGNDNVALYLKGVGDGLTAAVQAGIQYKNGAGLAAKVKAAVLSGRATAELDVYGWQIEFGISGDLLSVGAEAMIGIFPDEGFTAKSSVGTGLFGSGFIFRVKPTW